MINNRFERGPESWCSYDYHASMVADGINIFILATWSPEGGPNGTGCIWTDHRRWSADTPDRPLSILPLLHYRSWVDSDPVDLRGAEMTAWLRGDQLVLDGAACYFWVHAAGTRWHCTAHPLHLAEGTWSENRLLLAPDPQAWHCSWSSDPERPTPLDQVLEAAHSYGFSFAGFSSEVTGRIGLADFALRRPSGA